MNMKIRRRRSNQNKEERSENVQKILKFRLYKTLIMMHIMHMYVRLKHMYVDHT